MAACMSVLHTSTTASGIRLSNCCLSVSVSVVFILQCWTAKSNKYNNNNNNNKILQRGVWSMIRPLGYLLFNVLSLTLI